jgi:mRNA interferase RelE/StbE
MWRLTILPSALRELAALQAKNQQRIDRGIQGLAQNPRPARAKALRGKSKGLMRLRVGDYRVIYRVDDADHEVTVIQIAHRRDVYRG